MTSEDQKKLNNLYQRYKLYDNDGVKYAFDICYTTLDGGRQVKAKRDSGMERCRAHIKELMENFDDVYTITISDYNGRNAKSKPINDPVQIQLIDVKNMDTPRVIIRENNESPPPKHDFLQGLGNLFAGTQFEGLGVAAPYFKMYDDKHTIERMREKGEEQKTLIDELKRKCENLEQRYEALERAHDQLQDDADNMEDELNEYHARDKKQDRLVSLAGATVASVAKNFLKQNPAILSGIIPADQLAGLLADGEATTQLSNNVEGDLTDEEKSRLDDATTVFDWLQTLDEVAFSEIISVIAELRKNTGYATGILSYLHGNKLVKVS